MERILLASDGPGAWTGAAAAEQAVIMRAGCPVMVVREPGSRV